MPLLYGYILEWDGYSDSAKEKSFRDELTERLLSFPDFKIDSRGASKLNPSWQSFWFISKRNLHDIGSQGISQERQSSALDQPDNTYPFMLRINSNNGTILIVAPMYVITDAVVERFNFLESPNLTRKIIDVHKVSQFLLDDTRSKDYSITYFLADVPGYGSDLRSITLYGNDISEADFLRTERKNFSARKIGVRPFNSSRDAGRFNNYGMIQFRSENIDVFEDFLRYSHKNSFYIE